jgi:hypothetical protein
MLVGRCSSQLSGHQTMREIKKVTTSERTRISRHAALDMARYAAFVRESRIKIANVTKLNRKSGVT